jgi:hypothetical protein
VSAPNIDPDADLVGRASPAVENNGHTTAEVSGTGGSTGSARCQGKCLPNSGIELTR